MGLIKAWSYSRYATYATCPFQAKCKFVDKLPEEEGPALQRGKDAHDDAAAYLRGDMTDEQAAERIPGWGDFADVFRQLRSLEPLVEQQWGFGKNWAPTTWFGKDVRFRSVLDAAAIYADGTADVVDHKTGKPRPDHGQQAELYAISVMLRHHVNQVTVRFWYLDHGSESVYRFSKSDVEPLIAKWDKATKRMLSDTIMAPKPGAHCNWCSFAKSKDGPCRYG